MPHPPRLTLRMRHLFATLALSLLTLSFFFSSSLAFAATKSPTVPAGPETICLKDFDPQSGWVIVGISSTQWWNTSCGGPFQMNLTVTIEPPPIVQTNICGISPIPINFVVIAQGLDSTCGDHRIIMPIGAITNEVIDVCGSSPVPINWVVTAETRNIAVATTCFKDANSALLDQTHPIQKTIGPVPDATTTLTICSDSLIPAGFVAHSNTTSDSCPLDHGNALFIMRDATRITG